MHRGTDNKPDAQRALPNWLLWLLGGACLVPFVLFLVGVELGSSTGAAAAHPDGQDMYRAMSGEFVHTLFEWTAVCTAIVTAILAFIHFRLSRDLATPVIGLALLCAGFMDAFHALASVRLIAGAADPANFITFTWALSRIFGAIVLISGAALVLVRRWKRIDSYWFVGIGGLGFIACAWVLMLLCARSTALPRSLFPHSLVTRPFDLMALLLYLGGGVPLLWRLHKRHPSLFSHALLIGLIPMVASEAYMAFGSQALFDAHFNAAHVLKIVAYVVPMSGLLLDYERSFRERAATAQALRESEARFSLAVRGTNVGIWDWNPLTNEVWFAPRYKALLGYRDDEFPDRMDTFNEHLHPDDHDVAWDAIKSHFERGTPYDVEYRLRTRDGEYRWFRARGSAVRDDTGEPVRMAGSIQDVTDRKAAHDQLEAHSKRLAQASSEYAEDARIDPLTKMLGRRAWEETLQIEHERSCRYEHLYTVIRMDLDHFKQFNDAAGQVAGDECLESLAACVRQSCRMIDVVGRYGGEEFVLLLPETDVEGGQVVATRLLEAVRVRAVPHPGLGAKGLLTVSIGVAEGPSVDGWKDVLDRADKALREAKSAGRDQIKVYGGDEQQEAA